MLLEVMTRKTDIKSVLVQLESYQILIGNTVEPDQVLFTQVPCRYNSR